MALNVKTENKPAHMKDVLDILIKTHGQQAGMRLFGFMMYIALTDDMKQVDRTKQLLWEDVTLIKKAGLLPDDLKPLKIGAMTKILFTSGFRATIAIMNHMSISPDKLDRPSNPEDVENARELAIQLGLAKHLKPKETKNPEVKATPGV